MKRSTAQAIAVLVGVFALGVLAGGAATYAYAKREQAMLIGPGYSERRIRGLERRLNLTAEQSRQVEAVFAKHHDEMERLRREMFDDCGQPMRDRIEAVDAEIRAVLNPEQQQVFDVLLKERKQRGLLGPPGRGHRGRRGPGGPHGPGGPPPL